ncbi:MAG: ATP-binding cassette domain-containing protein, partial [Rhabdochlamydiaceae bacterium]
MKSAIQSALIQVTELSCGYGSNAVLSNATFNLNPGEILALLGPNGSGKSTLLKTLSGSLSPLAGTIQLQGKDFHQLPSRNRAQIIGFVPQDEEH